jgi:beta-lactamase regulating signal transducer with metallopeptidase domain
VNHLLMEFTIRATLIVTCTGIVLWATQIRNAAARHSAWRNVMFLMLLLPLWIKWGPGARVPVPAFLPPSVSAVIRIPEGSAQKPAVASSTQIGPESERSASQNGSNSTRLILSIYLMGACTFLIRLGIGTIYAHRLVGRAVLHKGHLASPSCAVAITLGALHPVTLLPSNWGEWSRQQLEVVLAHEREHARRRDPLIQWIALFNRALFWFHPLAWWIEHQLSYLAERACDDAVLARGYDPQDYSELLLAMERSAIRSARRLNLIGVEMPGSFLPRRIRQILEFQPTPPISRKQVACAVAACVVSFGFLAGATPSIRPMQYPNNEGLRVSVAAVGRTPQQWQGEHPPLPRALPLPQTENAMIAKVSTTPGFESQPHPSQSVAPKWVGTWILNKEKSNFGRDPGIRGMLDSIESVTLGIKAASEGVAITSDLVAIRPVLRQHSEFALKFGVGTNLKDVNPIMGLAYPGTLTIVPVLENSLNLTVAYLDGSGFSNIRFDVSADGNTLTESFHERDDFRIVFDKRF